MVVLAGVVSGQKGGAKGAMRGNRGKVRPGGELKYQEKGFIYELTNCRAVEEVAEGAGVAAGTEG